jgi:hypothetical protein
MQSRNELREKLAALEHSQWEAWSKTLLATENISEERTERWQQYGVPYDQLPETVKEYDREWADKVLGIVDELSQETRAELEQLRLEHRELTAAVAHWKARAIEAEERIKKLEAPKDEPAPVAEPEQMKPRPWWRRLLG